MKKIDVSIIIPVYNVEKYLEKCLSSLVKQTLKNIEIIVVNDGTKDNSQKIIDKFVKEYPKLIISIIKENGGQGSARNLGLKHASGEYIGYVDSDDYVEKDMFEKMFNKAKEENLDIVVCGNNIVDESYNVIKTETPIIFNDERNILFGKPAVWNKIYKHKILEGLEFRSKKLYEDLDFSLKLLLKDYKIGYIDEYLYNYLLRAGSSMNNSNIGRNLDIIDAFEETINYYKKNNKYKKIQSELEILAVEHIYISSIVRVILSSADYKNKTEIINKLKYYVDNSFPNYMNNKYLKDITKKRRIILYLIKNKLYFLVKILFAIKGAINGKTILSN